MIAYVLDELLTYGAFSKRLEARASRVEDFAGVNIQIFNNSLYNAYNHWAAEFDSAVSNNEHVRQKLNILQLNLEILYRSLMGRRLMKVVRCEPINDPYNNVITLFPALGSRNLADARGKKEFQNLIVSRVDQYVAIDFCTDLYRDLMRSRGEFPFGKKEDIQKMTVAGAVTALNYNTNRTFFDLMSLPNLPIGEAQMAR